MKTIPLYFDNPYLFASDAEVFFIGQDERGAFVVLDKTLFYPQGGGQPYDLGKIDRFDITAVRWVDDEIRHYTSQDLASLLGRRVTLSIDPVRRIQNSRCHSAGHLLSHIVESHYSHLKGIKGHHYQDGAYVEFTGSNRTQIDLDLINKELAKAIECKYTITLHNESTKRFVQIGPYPPYACGGTHVKTLSELAHATATKQKLQRDILRISYATS